jgi:basic membrane protein A
MVMGLSRSLSIILVIIVVVAAIGILVVFVSQRATPTTTTPTQPPTRSVSAAVVIRKRGDLGFNDLAWIGGELARKNLNASVEYFYYENVPQAQWLSFLENIVKKGFDVIIVVNFMMAEQVAELADKYPEQKFAIIDAVVEGKPNVMSIVFRENEGSALVGALAGYLTNSSTVGIVLGMDIPPLWKFEIGYKFGIHYVMNETGKNIRILWVYLGTFGDPSKGKEAALSMLQEGADIIYHAAGETGLGVFDAVYEYSQKTGRKVYAIGVDTAQEWVRPGYIIASMMKHVDVAVYKAIEDVYSGNFKGGVISLGIKEGGVDISRPEDIKNMIDIAVSLKLMSQEEADKIYSEILQLRNSIPSDVWDKVMQLRNKVINGEISVPIPTSDTITQLREIYG